MPALRYVPAGLAATANLPPVFNLRTPCGCSLVQVRSTRNAAHQAWREGRLLQRRVRMRARARRHLETIAADL